jgi:uncharacterized protein (TIGR04141 family)
LNITLHRLHSSAPFNREVLTSEEYREVPLTGAPKGFRWKLFVRQGNADPEWVSFLTPIATDPAPLSHLVNASSSAVLLVRHDRVVYAVTFGYGSKSLRSNYITPSFGLRVVVNSIGGDAVMSSETRVLGNPGKVRRTQLAEADNLTELGIDPSHDWTRRLSGRGKDESFAKLLEGADSLRLTATKFSIQDLPEKIRKIKDLYADLAYQTDFSWIDDVQVLGSTDPVIATLEDLLASKLQDRRPEVSFSVPARVLAEENTQFTLSVGRDRRSLTLLSTREIRKALDHWKELRDPLRTIRVRTETDTGRGDTTKPLRDYCNAEVRHAKERYFTLDGVWYRVSKKLIDQVFDFAKTVDDCSSSLALPTWLPAASKDGKASEGTYNATAARIHGYVLLDKQNVTFFGQQKFEPCDLLTPDRQMIHVKRASSSGSLSHLFAQGDVSTQNIHDQAFQNLLEKRLQEISPSARFGSVGDWTVVFAIVTDKKGPLSKSMFFFSLIHLRTTVLALRRLGVKVAMCKIRA